MDSITHIAIGACIGEAFFEKGFGKKAMLWGTLAQSIPDIDFIASLWLAPSENLLAHRGFTHSFLFALLIIPAFAATANRLHQPHNITLKKWYAFFSTEVILHLLLDGLNNYGVGWLEPFDHHRYSLNTIYVADPFFSLWPGIALAILVLLHRYHPKRSFWWKFGLFPPLLYLCYCGYNKTITETAVKQIFAAQQIPHQQYFTTPAPLQNWLWYVVAGNDSGYYVGFRSVFDREKKINFRFFPKNNELLNAVDDHDELQRLKRFSQGFYTVEKYKDTLVFNDLRFGQIIGWQNPKEKFVFHYYLQHKYDNRLVVQRGRFAGWDWDVVKGMLKRIKGN